MQDDLTQESKTMKTPPNIFHQRDLRFHKILHIYACIYIYTVYTLIFQTLKIFRVYDIYIYYSTYSDAHGMKTKGIKQVLHQKLGACETRFLS